MWDIALIAEGINYGRIWTAGFRLPGPGAQTHSMWHARLSVPNSIFGRAALRTQTSWQFGGPVPAQWPAALQAEHSNADS